MPDDKSHKRVNDILLGPLERPALQWLAAHQPRWMNPDILTGIGIAGAVLVFVGYLLTNQSKAFLWLVNAGFVINWYGDSLDGTLARYRKIERPKFGFFIDHTVDAFSQVLIVIGLGLSPYVRLDIAAMALCGYLLMSIYVYVDTYVTGVFKISYGKLGPTEVRLLIMLANTAVFFFDNPSWETAIGEFSLFDFFAGGIGLILFFLFSSNTIRRARELAKLGG